MLVALAPRAMLGPWLAAVDLDVQRLPDKIIYPLLGWQALAAIMMALITGDPSSGWRAPSAVG
jgi:leader peptidase (prepilin peptidase) / N-methyltransferase